MSRKPKPEAPSDLERIAALREPTEAEAEGMAAARARRAQKPARPSIATERDDGSLRTFPPHRDHVGWVAHLEDAFGTRSRAFAETSIVQLETILRPAGAKAEAASDDRLNYALALLAGTEPADELQAALGVQIAAAHTLSMEFLGRASVAENVARAEAYANMATKLSRTMIAGVEALAKLRPRGPQRIEVYHVQGSANFGTQVAYTAGNGGALPGGEACETDQPLRPLPMALVADAGGAQVWGQDAARYGLPGPGDQGPAAVQVSRRDEPRCADREGERALHVGPLHAGGSGGSPACARRPGPGVA